MAMELKLPRRRLARIRCIQDCIECFRCNRPMPKSICYIPAQVEYRVTSNAKVTFLKEPKKQSGKVTSHNCPVDARIVASGEELCNADGQWVNALSVRI